MPDLTISHLKTDNRSHIECSGLWSGPRSKGSERMKRNCRSECRMADRSLFVAPFSLPHHAPKRLTHSRSCQLEQYLRWCSCRNACVGRLSQLTFNCVSHFLTLFLERQFRHQRQRLSVHTNCQSNRRRALEKSMWLRNRILKVLSQQRKWLLNIYLYLPMAGRKTPMGKSPLYFRTKSSASAFVSVYVLGHLHRILIEMNWVVIMKQTRIFDVWSLCPLRHRLNSMSRWFWHFLPLPHHPLKHDVLFEHCLTLEWFLQLLCRRVSRWCLPFDHSRWDNRKTVLPLYLDGSLSKLLIREWMTTKEAKTAEERKKNCVKGFSRKISLYFLVILLSFSSPFPTQGRPWCHEHWCRRQTSNSRQTLWSQRHGRWCLYLRLTFVYPLTTNLNPKEI